MTSSAPQSPTQHNHTPQPRETYRVGERVTVLGTRRATVITATDARGFSTVLPDNGTPAVRVHADVLVPVPTVSNVKTSELAVGDIVNCASGWVRLVGLIREWDYSGAGRVFSFDGRILGHAEQVAAGHDTARWIARWIAGVNRGHTSADQWTVQGNDLARWTIEARR